MKWTIFFVIILCASSVSAWEFTEIMANPEGGDEGKEWVELFGDPLPATARFIEDGGSHYTSLISGTCTTNCIIIIADDASWFLATYTIGDDVLVYDSSWGSLRNSGETISLQGNDAIVASETYTDAPSGLSAQEGVWIAPTPGTTGRVAEVEEFSALSALLTLALVGIFFISTQPKN